MHFWQLLTDIGILLGSSLLLGAIAIRLKLSPIIGYLIAGMVLGGPGSLQLIKSPLEIEAIAELGVSLLLFSLGLEFSWGKIKSLPLKIIRGGALQILLTPLFFLAVSSLCGLDIKIAILAGLIFTLSSTATVLRTFNDLAEIDSQHGRNSTAVLLLQDIAVIPFTMIVSFISVHNAVVNKFQNNFLFTIGAAVVLVLGLYVFLNKIAGPALSLFSLNNNREMAILLAIIISIGSAWTAYQIGISPSVGAFIAGMLLGTSSFATQITADIAPLRILFLTLFFGSAGMLADPVWVFNNFALVILLSVAVILSKTLISSVIFSLSGHSIAISVASALSIAQIGEFAFVLSDIAKDSSLLSNDWSQLVVSVTIVSLFFTPFMIKFAPRIGLKVQQFLNNKKSGEVFDAEVLSSNPARIYVIGYGPAGREVTRQLKDSYLDEIAIMDLTKDSLDSAELEGFKTYMGDVRQLDVLQHSGLELAHLVIITIPSYDAVLTTIDNIKRLAPTAHIIVRSRYQIYEQSFHEAGAHEIVNEEFTVGEKLGRTAVSYLAAVLPK
ncbi:MAG: cation:proton antiporter [Candidatus Melainabacteria bacterium]|nr:cation:proton antiporter [Candidatus Melainabacteria bacterium]